MNSLGKKNFLWGPSLLIFSFFGVFYLTPYGFVVGGEVLWFTDIVSIVLLLGVMLGLFACNAKFKFNEYKVSSTLFLLLVFFFFEFILPLVGVVIWSDIGSATSSLRALLYWLPFLLLFSIFSPADGFDLKKLDNLFFIAVSLNLFYGLIELAIYFEMLPEFMNFRLYLSDFAPQERFFRNRMMSFGFFQNSTSYGVFGLLALVHFLSRLLQIDSHKIKYLFFALLSLVIIVLSTSRVPLAAAFICFASYIVLVKRTQWNILLSLVFVVLGSVLIISLFSIDIALFSRFTRLVDGGLKGDYSLNYRMTVYWPNALAYYFDLGHPTFTNPTKNVGTIDSGYLTYLLQGGWLMLFLTTAMLASFILLPLVKAALTSRRDYFQFLLLFISIYVTLGMLISNPMRNPLVIVFLCFAVFGFASQKKSGGKI